MTPAFQQRCVHHPAREAAVRCPLCRNYFCRECVTEHADRLVCAACLARQRAPGQRPRARLWQWIGPALGALLALGFFSMLGWALSNLT